ncbi:MAG: hypothetical protein P1U56_25990 [Saprospiraceae bacterium]|nr:hypothetical protein [Saprospiraceae bacterium]
MKKIKTELLLVAILIMTSCNTISHLSDTCTIKHHKKVFDLTNGYANGGEPDQKILDEFLSVSANPCPIYIDWQLTFSGIEDFDCNNSIVSTTNGDKLSNSNDSDMASYAIPVNAYSTHFLFDVIIGPTSQYPFNSVSCYQSGGNLTINIKGYYSAISYRVPTADALELRPINPNFIFPTD